MCSVWVVAIQNTPNARLGHVTSILNHVTAILYCDSENRVIHEQITTKVPGDGGRLPHEVAVQLTAQSGRRSPMVTVVVGDDTSTSTADLVP